MTLMHYSRIQNSSNGSASRMHRIYVNAREEYLTKTEQRTIQNHKLKTGFYVMIWSFKVGSKPSSSVGGRMQKS